MHNIHNPEQKRLFDPILGLLSTIAVNRLNAGWQGVIRHVILKLMPVQEVAAKFSQTLGRPTKELYSMCGLILVMEFNKWTCEQAALQYMIDLGLQYALNLDSPNQSMSVSTIERYIRIIETKEIASKIFEVVTRKLVNALDIKIDQQRLDSTHIESDMATFGRTRLMGTVVKRFLTQVGRKDRELYKSLPDELRKRYEPPSQRLFGDAVKNPDARRLARQQVAEDMRFVINRFADLDKFNGLPTFLDLLRVFHEQCRVEDDKVVVREKTGGDVMQNPSDPDATYDGHKGQGFKVQISQTCSGKNDKDGEGADENADKPDLVLCVIPQTAVEHDAHALEPVLDKLCEQGMKPAQILADTAYGSDENVQMAEARGVEVVSPVQGAVDDESIHGLNLDDFAVDEKTGEVECCPNGVEPETTYYDRNADKSVAVMPSESCEICEFRKECPIKRNRKGRFELRFRMKDLRIAARRREQATDVFKERYAVRSGIESLNSGLKRRVGLSRLRVRGKTRVFSAIFLKIAGWNLLQAASSPKMRKLVAEMAIFYVYFIVFCIFSAIINLARQILRRSGADHFCFHRTIDDTTQLTPDF